jgi:hypothetical protein
MTGYTLFDSVPWTIWTAVECNIAITAASVPNIIPLIKKFHAIRKGAAIGIDVHKLFVLGQGLNSRENQ